MKRLTIWLLAWLGLAAGGAQAQATLDRVEYFIDSDPGQGLATSVPLGTVASNIPNLSFVAPLGGYARGLHRLGVRSRNLSQKWSSTAYRQFFYENAVLAGNIDRVEYFLDTDPGVGSATAVTITPGADLPSVAFAVNLSSVGQGFHRLYVRSHDAGTGRWSLSGLQQFYYQPPTVLAAGNIDRVEYFLDTDPGVGSATAASITPGANLPSVTFAADLSGVNQGFHRLYVRSRDAGSGRWSLTALNQFYYQPPTVLAAGNIDRMEYFLDTDPGVGSATAVAITPGANLASVAFAVNMSSINAGVHQLYVRSHDAGSDRWSLTANRYFFAEIVPALANMTQVEYFYDADPGIGLGTAAPVASPATNLSGFAFVGDITALSAGTHRLYVRSRNASGKWSLTGYRDFVRPSGTPPSISSFTPTVGTGGTVITITGTNFLGATAVTFNGVAGTGLTVNSATQITITAPASGSTGLLCVTAAAGTGCSNAAQKFTYLPVVTGITPTVLCAGAAVSVTFTATGYAVGNTFTAQLSNSSGTFTSGVTNLGTRSGATGGTISGTVPTGATGATAYRVRIVADNPAATGSNNGTNIVLENLTNVAAISNSPVQTGSSIQLNTTGYPSGATFAWTGPGAFSSATVANPTIANATTANTGTYQVVVTGANGCQKTSTVAVTVNAPVVLTTGPITPATYCAGDNISVPYTASGGTVSAGNAFTAQLSSASGSFVSPVNIGTVSGTGSGTIAAVLPTGAATGTGYRVRVVGNSPPATGTDNGTNLTITNLSAALATSNSPVTVGGTVQLDVTGYPAGATFAWTGPNAFSSTIRNPTIPNAALASTGTYQVVVSSNGCQATRTVDVSVSCNSASVADGLPTGNYTQQNFSAGGSNLAFNGGQATSAPAVATATVLFGSPQVVSGFGSINLYGNNRASQLTYYLTFDGTTFQNVGTGYNGPISTYTTFDFTGGNRVALGFKIVVEDLDHSHSNGVYLKDARVFGNVCAPYISSFAPATGPAGTSVVLTGGNFTGATGVTFNGVAAPGFVVNNDGQITVAAPATGSTGLIAVTNSSGLGTSATNFTYQLGVATGTVSPATYCAGGAVTVPFTVSGGSYSAGNTFTAQLSNASGSFAAPTAIGSVSRTTSGSISATVPTATTTGSGYRIRVVASNPATTGTDNGSNLTITNLSATAATSNSPLTVGGTIQLDVSNAPTGATFAWTGPGTFSNASAQNPTVSNAQTSNSGTYQVVVSSNGCQVTRTVSVTVNNAPGLTMSTFNGALCGGQSFSIGFAATGSAFQGGNTATAQLSDASGSFASAASIGSVSNVVNTGSYSVSVTIPANTPTGTGYRVRLVASSPAATSNDNGANLSITALPAAAVASNNSPVAYNGTVTLTAQAVSGASYVWTVPGIGTVSTGTSPTLNVANATPANSGTYTLTVSYGGNCPNSTTTSVTVNPATVPILNVSQFGGTVCPGGFLSVGYAVTGTGFAAGNVLTAQLSDAAGSFATPTNVGTDNFRGPGSGTITAVFPTATPAGTGYRIRVVGSSPAVVSQTDNGSDLTVSPALVASATSNSPVAVGGTITLVAQPTGQTGMGSYYWYAQYNGGGATAFVGVGQTLNIANAQPSQSGKYFVYVSNSNCTDSASVRVLVQSAATASLSTGSFGGSFCPGSVFNVPFTVSGSFNGGNVFTAQLSNASGSFASAVNIGSVSGTGSGNVSVTIPLGTANGTAYRIRVVASAPATTGSDNGQNLTIGALTFTWTGGANSTDWFDAGNWSCGQVPTSTSVVIIPNLGAGFAYYPVVVGGTASVLNITVQTSASLTINSTFHLYGNVTADGSVTGSTGSSWYFYGGSGGTQYVYGSQALQFGNLYINPGVTLNQQSHSGMLNVYGSWYNNGFFFGNPNPLYGVGFNGGGTAQCVCGTASTNFYGFTVSPTALVNLGINTNFLGNLAVNGTFNSSSWAVVFNGTVGQTIGGAGNTFFNNIRITNTVGVTLVDDVTIRGNWINDGQFNPSTYAVIFAGTTAQTIGGSVVTHFYNVTFQNLISVTLNLDIYVLGNFVNTGVFYGYQTVGGVRTGYYVRFGGGTAQMITAGAQTYFYHFYVDNAAGVSLGTNIHIAGNYYLYSGFFNPGTYVCDFNGFGGYEQTVGGYQPLTFYGWNIGSGTTVRLNQNCSWLGGIVNAGDFYGYTFVGGVYTGYGCTFAGSTAQVLSGAGNYYFWHVTLTNTLASVTFNTNVHVYGNWLNGGVWSGTGYTVFFDGMQAQLIGGSVITNFYHVTINNLISVSLQQNIYVLGNWSGNGRFFGTGYYTYFNGTAAQTIFCASNTRFGTVRFSNPTSVTLLSDIYLNGNWTHDGGFVANGYTVYFSGSATQFIAGTTQTVFHHVNIVSGATVQINRAITLLGNWFNNGSFLHNNLLVYFNGTLAQIVGGSQVTNFYDVTFNNAVSVTLNQNIYVLGNFINSGVFYGYSGATGYFVRFAGSVLQVVNANATTYFHHFFADNAAGVQLMRDVYIAGNFYLYSGSFLHNGYTCYFNGTAPQTCGGYAALTFFGWNIATGADLTLNQNCTLLGSFANAGTFHCSSPFRMTFAGSVAQALSGTGAFNFWHVTWNNLVGITLNRDITVLGDWFNSGGFLANGYRVFFGGTLTQFIDGTVTTIFHHLTINTGATVQINRTITLLGDWLNNGNFLHNSLLVYFNGTVLQTIGGSSVTRFYDLTLNNNINVSLGYDIDVVRHFINQGGFCGCGFLVRFNGTVPQTITCTSGRTNFHHITFANVQGVTMLDNVGVSGNWVNNGGYIANGYLVLFNGTALQTIGGTTLTAFHHWQNTNASTAGVTLLRDVAYTGNWTNNGRYCGCGFGSLFNGSLAQSLTCTTGNSNFHHLTLANTSAGGVTLTGNINVSGNWLVSGFWFPQTYTVFFNGTAGQSIVLGGSVVRADFHGLTIANTSTAGVTLSLNTPLWLTGNFANNGAFFCGLNGVWANGTALQTFGGTAPTRFYDWTILNPAGASCTGTGGTATVPALGIQHVLTLATGSGNLACGGHLTLLSNASGTAMVVNAPNGGQCTGVATMERFIDGLGSVGYRHYSSPMKRSAGGVVTNVQQFADDLPVFELNPSYNTLGNVVRPFPTLFKYEEARLTAAKPGFDEGWMTPAAAEDLEPLRGYSAMTDPTTVVDISGVLQNGPVSFSLNRGGQPGSGFQLLGNPYPAPMDWDVARNPVNGMLTNVADALYVFQPSGRYTGTFKSYVNGVGQNGGSKDLAAMQGFFVRSTAASASVGFTNAVRRTAYAAPAFNRAAPASPTASGPARPVLRLTVAPATQPTMDDEAVLYFEAGAGLGFSPRHDAYKVQLNGSGRPSVWTLAPAANASAPAEAFAINGLPNLATAPVVPLAVRVTATGRYVLDLSAALALPAGTQIWLEDRALNRRQNLAATPRYAFEMNAAYTGQRFYLNFVAGRPTAVTSGALAARLALFPNPATATTTVELSGLGNQPAAQLTVLNALGQAVLKTTAPVRQGAISATLALGSLPTGIYTVRIATQEGTATRRLVKE